MRSLAATAKSWFSGVHLLPNEGSRSVQPSSLSSAITNISIGRFPSRRIKRQPILSAVETNQLLASCPDSDWHTTPY